MKILQTVSCYASCARLGSASLANEELKRNLGPLLDIVPNSCTYPPSSTNPLLLDYSIAVVLISLLRSISCSYLMSRKHHTFIRGHFQDQNGTSLPWIIWLLLHVILLCPVLCLSFHTMSPDPKNVLRAQRHQEATFARMLAGGYRKFKFGCAFKHIQRNTGSRSHSVQLLDVLTCIRESKISCVAASCLHFWRNPSSLCNCTVGLGW